MVRKIYEVFGFLYETEGKNDGIFSLIYRIEAKIYEAEAKNYRMLFLNYRIEAKIYQPQALIYEAETLNQEMDAPGELTSTDGTTFTRSPFLCYKKIMLYFCNVINM
jgi:hypothetical protein